MSGNEDRSPANPANAWMEDPSKMARVRQVQQDFAWAQENWDDLEWHYAGEYVVVWKRHVVDHGKDLGEVLRRASTAESPREELAVVEVPALFEIPPDASISFDGPE